MSYGDPVVRQRSYHLDSATGMRYDITLEGTLDRTNTVYHPRYLGLHHLREQYRFEPNVCVVLANTGRTPIRQPRLVVNGTGMWLTVNDMLTELLGDEDDEREIALRLFGFFARTDVQSHNNYMRCGQLAPWRERAPDDPAFLFRVNPLQATSTFYASGCVTNACTLGIAFRAAGLATRVSYLAPAGTAFVQHHAVVEAHYDGGWHLFDPELRTYFFGADDRTIASLSEVLEDRSLLKRGTFLGGLAEDVDAAYWANELYGASIPVATIPIDDTASDLVWSLRPGERLILRWSDERLYHYGVKADYDVPQPPWHLSNSTHELALDLTDPESLNWVSAAENLHFSDRGFVAVDPTVESAVTIRMSSPFPAVRVRLTTGHAPDADVQAALAANAAEWMPIPRSEAASSFAWPVPVDSGPHRDVYLRVRWRECDSGTADFVHVCLDIQLSRQWLPALSLGTNHIELRHATRTSVSARIDHSWREIDVAVPSTPTVSGAELADHGFRLAWCVNDDLAADFDTQVVVSEANALERPATPATEAIVRNGGATVDLPALGIRWAVDRYAARCRVRAGDGPWSAWSSWVRVVRSAPDTHG